MEVPCWSGEFHRLNDGVYVMCMSVHDERSITPPPGLALVSEMETFGGEATAYVYMKIEEQVSGF